MMDWSSLVVSRRYVVTLTDGDKAEACIGQALLVEWCDPDGDEEGASLTLPLVETKYRLYWLRPDNDVNLVSPFVGIPSHIVLGLGTSYKEALADAQKRIDGLYKSIASKAEKLSALRKRTQV